MRETIKFSKFLLVLVLSASVVMNGCKKDDEGDPPELPPKSALLMDFTGFESQKKSVEQYHFAQAALTVWFWDILALATVAVPSVAYAEAFNHDPVYKGDNSWEWAYSITQGQVEFSVKLVSQRISNEEFTLKFYVTTSEPVYYGQSMITLEDFMWFEGTVRYDRTTAEWTLYDPVSEEGLLDISWEYNYEEDTWMIRYDIVDEENEQYGSYIEQGHTTNAYNAYFEVQFGSDLTNIEWETTGFSGRIKAPHSFGDSDWHCWDEDKLDVECE